MTEDSRADDGGSRSWLRRRWRFFSGDFMTIGVILVVLFAFMLPSMIVTIPAGHLGVLWKRFGGGTVQGPPGDEGTRLILPWDKAIIYDARLQSITRQFEVLSSDGLTLTVDLTWRFRVIPGELGALHQYAGPAYAETLLAPSIGARARDVIALYRPEDIYTVHRLKIQEQIRTTVAHDLRSRFNPSDAKARAWLVLEDVMLKRIVLPPGVQNAIVRKNMARHEVDEYALKVEKEHQETERKRVEALGIRNFQEIVSHGMTEDYLRWRGLEATLELARSNNAKVVIVGNNRTGGLPLISFSGDSPAPAVGTPATASTPKRTPPSAPTDAARPETAAAPEGTLR